MRVSEAVASRISCRAFLPDPVAKETVCAILNLARMAPSGGNLQPWHVYALTGEPLRRLVGDVAEQLRTTPRGEATEYPIYPEGLKEPYRSRRSKCGEDLYSTIGIERADRPGRWRQFHNNFRFFGAPVGLFFYIDRQMGPPQWTDLGMFLQTVMLIAREHGLHTCAQEAWAHWHGTVARHLAPPADLMLFCGMAMGHMDASAAVNGLRTDRAEVGEFSVFLGF